MTTSQTTTTWLSACGVLLKVEPVDLTGPSSSSTGGRCIGWRAPRPQGAAGMPPVIHLDEFRVSASSLRAQPQPQRPGVRDFGLHIDGPRCGAAQPEL